MVVVKQKPEVGVGNHFLIHGEWTILVLRGCK